MYVAEPFPTAVQTLARPTLTHVGSVGCLGSVAQPRGLAEGTGARAESATLERRETPLTCDFLAPPARLKRATHDTSHLWPSSEAQDRVGPCTGRPAQLGRRRFSTLRKTTKESPLAHAVVIQVTLPGDGRDEEGRKMLEQVVVPNAKSQPGFKSGVWMNKDNEGRAVVIFDTEANAKAARDNLKPPPGGPTLVSAEVYEVGAEA